MSVHSLAVLAHRRQGVVPGETRCRGRSTCLPCVGPQCHFEPVHTGHLDCVCVTAKQPVSSGYWTCRYGNNTVLVQARMSRRRETETGTAVRIRGPYSEPSGGICRHGRSSRRSRSARVAAMAQPECRSRSASDEIRPGNATRPLSRRASDGNTADALLLLQDTDASQQPVRRNSSTPGDLSGTQSQHRHGATRVCACTRCQRVVGGAAIAVVLLGAIVFVVVDFATSRHLVDAVTSFLDWVRRPG